VYLIDSNLVYYGTGLNITPDFPSAKVTAALSALKDAFISDISIIELIAHHPDPKQGKMVHDYLHTLPLSYRAVTYPGIQILNDFRLPSTYEAAKYAVFHTQVKEFKVQYECQLISFCLEAIVAAFSHILFKDAKLDTDSKRQKLMLHMKALLVSNRSFLQTLVTQALVEFYVDSDSDKLKGKLEDALSILAFVTNVNYVAATKDEYFYETTPATQTPGMEKNIALSPDFSHS